MALNMRPAHLHVPEAEAIPVRLATSDKATLLECHAPGRFLAHVTGGRWSEPLLPELYLRGVVSPGEGALFSLCGPLGLVDDEVVRLSTEEAQRLILDLLW